MRRTFSPFLFPECVITRIFLSEGIKAIDYYCNAYNNKPGNTCVSAYFSTNASKVGSFFHF